MKGRAGAVACALFAAAPAHAHLIETGLGPVYDGITHFATSAQDLLPAIALALFAGRRGAAHGRRVIGWLPSAWFVGGCAGIAMAASVPTAGWNLAWLPLLAFGLMVAFDRAVPLAVTTALAIGAGLLLGFENGLTMAPPGPATAGLVGVTACAFVVVTLTAAAVVAYETPLARIAARVAGSWIAAIGILLLGWSLR